MRCCGGGQTQLHAGICHHLRNGTGPQRATAHRPDDRYADAKAMAAAIAEAWEHLDPDTPALERMEAFDDGGDTTVIG